jgi:hypothetical protein
MGRTRGNLDAEIYLPHVIENMTGPIWGQGSGQGSDAQDAVRLRQAEPGRFWRSKESPNYTGELTPAQEAEIAAAAAQKKERRSCCLLRGRI